MKWSFFYYLPFNLENTTSEGGTGKVRFLKEVSRVREDFEGAIPCRALSHRVTGYKMSRKPLVRRNQGGESQGKMDP